MSFLNRSSASSATQNTTNDTTISTVDNRVSEGNARVGGNVTLNSGDVSGPISISTTDQGAVQAGLDLGLESLRAIQQATNDARNAANSQVSDLTAQAFGLANEARQSETSGAINNFLKYGVVVAVVAIGAWALTRAK